MMKPFICIIEDDPLRRSLVLELYEFEFSNIFELRFVVCEQHFFDLFGDDPDPLNHYTLDKNEERWVPVWNRLNDPIPSLFIIDMMTSWDDRDYKSDRRQPNAMAKHRAGLRIAQQLKCLRLEQRVQWFFWTAIDCQDMDKELEGAELHYKDSVTSYDLLAELAPRFLR